MITLFRHKSRLPLYVPIFVWCFIIFLLSSFPTLPGPPGLPLDFAFKKLAHMFMYFILFRLIYRAVLLDVSHPIKASIVTMVLTGLYAISDEYHQSFVPGRTSTGRDVLFDVLGATIAWFSIFKYI